MRFLKILNILVLAYTLFFACTTMLDLQPSIAFALSLLSLGVFQFLSGIILVLLGHKHFSKYLKLTGGYLLGIGLIAVFFNTYVPRELFWILISIVPLVLAAHFTYLTFLHEEEEL